MKLILLSEADDERRRLERLAAQGDEDAKARLARVKLRTEKHSPAEKLELEWKENPSDVGVASRYLDHLSATVDLSVGSFSGQEAGDQLVDILSGCYEMVVRIVRYAWQFTRDRLRNMLDHGYCRPEVGKLIEMGLERVWDKSIYLGNYHGSTPHFAWIFDGEVDDLGLSQRGMRRYGAAGLSATERELVIAIVLMDDLLRAFNHNSGMDWQQKKNYLNGFLTHNDSPIRHDGLNNFSNLIRVAVG